MFSQRVDSPLYYLSQKELFKTHRRKANPIYLKSCAFFGATLIDRTHCLDSGFDFHIIDTIPSGSCQLTFEEICSQRAREIINATEGPIQILWSGGIDSTVALVAIINESKTISEHSRIRVLLSKESIDEYPSFFNDVIKDKIPYRVMEGSINESILPDDVIVTGEHGDQLFGSDKLKPTILSNDAYSPYSEILDIVIARKLGTDKFSEQIIDYLQPVIEKCPFRIHTLFDYLWWINFTLKWQTVSMRIVHGIQRKASDLEKNVFHFFKTDDFQRWSISNHDKKIKSEWKSYKYIAKELIYQFHEDDNYLIHKEKEPSLKEVIRSKKVFGFFRLIRSKNN